MVLKSAKKDTTKTTEHQLEMEICLTLASIVRLHYHCKTWIISVFSGKYEYVFISVQKPAFSVTKHASMLHCLHAGEAFLLTISANLEACQPCQPTVRHTVEKDEYVLTPSE